MASLRESASKYGWQDRKAVALKAMTTGLALQLDPRDPLPGMLTLSIDRCELATAGE